MMKTKAKLRVHGWKDLNCRLTQAGESTEPDMSAIESAIKTTLIAQLAGNYCGFELVDSMSSQSRTAPNEFFVGKVTN